MGALGNVVFSKRAAPHQIAGTPVLPIRDHGAAGVTQRRPVFVNPDGVRDDFGPAAFAVKVDKSPDTAFLQETVSRHIVHGRIQAHIFNRKGRHMFFHFVESGKETDGVMAFCTGKTEQERYIRAEGREDQSPIPSGHPGQNSGAGRRKVLPEKERQAALSYVCRGGLREYVQQCHPPRP